MRRSSSIGRCLCSDLVSALFCQVNSCIVCKRLVFCEGEGFKFLVCALEGEGRESENVGEGVWDQCDVAFLCRLMQGTRK